MQSIRLGPLRNFHISVPPNAITFGVWQVAADEYIKIAQWAWPKSSPERMQWTLFE